MNPYEDKIAQFVEDDIMFNAVLAVFYEKCDLNTLDLKIPSVELGSRAQAFLQAREIVRDAAKELKTYKRHGGTPQSTNPAV